MIRITNEELEKSRQNYSSCANTWRGLLKLGSTILLLINCVFKTALQALGMESGAIPDANIQASSKKTGYDAWKGRLNGQSCWMPAYDNKTEYIMVTFAPFVRIVAIATQGAPKDGCWVKSYSIKYGISGAQVNEPKVKNSLFLIPKFHFSHNQVF